jgi:hypothetical protein
MELIWFSEMSVHRQTKRHYFPEAGNIEFDKLVTHIIVQSAAYFCNHNCDIASPTFQCGDLTMAPIAVILHCNVSQLGGSVCGVSEWSGTSQSHTLGTASVLQRCALRAHLGFTHCPCLFLT